MNSTMTFAVIGIASFGGGFLLLQAALAGYAAYQRRFTSEARVRLEEAFVFVNPNLLFAVSVAGTLIVAPLLWFLTGNGGLAILAVLACIAGPRISFFLINRRRRTAIVKQLPDVLLMLGSSLRAGTSLKIALDLAIRETPAPLSQELGVVVQETRLGVALEDALETMSGRLKLDEVDLVVTAMIIARDVGGNLAETLDRLAHTLRTKATTEGKIRALTSQGKLQGLIVGCLPLFLMLALSYMQPDAMRPLFSTWVGYVVLAVMAILELMGFFMIRKIVTIDV